MATMHYDFALRCYAAFLWCASHWHPKARALHRGRQGWREKLAAHRGVGQEWMWFHCASAGEYEDIVELMLAQRRLRPAAKILLTFFSPSGYQLHAQATTCDLVMYLPPDTRRNARDWVALLQPSQAFFSRSELWLHFLEALQQAAVPTYLICLGMQERSGFLKWPMRAIYRRCFDCFSAIFCKDGATAALLRWHFPALENVFVTGNTRVDRVYAAAQQVQDFEGLAAFTQDRFTIVVGSSLPRDTVIVMQAMQALQDLPIQWIIVPHEIDRAEIARWVALAPAQSIVYRDIVDLKPAHSMLYIDFVGGLKHLYRYAAMAIVGGGHDKIGIHNILEPAVHGVPMTFGPRHRNYPEALDLLQLQCATIHNDAAMLAALVRKRFETDDRATIASRLQSYIAENRGATQRILAQLARFHMADRHPLE